jgi:large subunit ribosomal protein L25
LNDITLPKGVTAVTRGKPNPVLVSVVATGGAEEAAEAAVEGAAPVAAAAAPEAKAAPAAKAAGAKEEKAKAPAKGKK